MLEETGDLDIAELLRNAYWMGYRDADQGKIGDPRFGPVPKKGLRIREVIQALRATPKLLSTSSRWLSSTTKDRPLQDSLCDDLEIVGDDGRYN